MAKTNEQLLRDALEKTTGLITSILAFKDSGGIDLDQPIMENTKALALEALERTTLDASVMTKDQAIAILKAERVLQCDTGDLVKPDGPDSVPGTAWNDYHREASRVISVDTALIREFADVHICTCKRCGDALDDKGYCIDQSCPYSGYLQYAVWSEKCGYQDSY